MEDFVTVTLPFGCVVGDDDIVNPYIEITRVLESKKNPAHCHSFDKIQKKMLSRYDSRQLSRLFSVVFPTHLSSSSRRDCSKTEMKASNTRNDFPFDNICMHKEMLTLSRSLSTPYQFINK